MQASQRAVEGASGNPCQRLRTAVSKLCFADRRAGACAAQQRPDPTSRNGCPRPGEWMSSVMQQFDMASATDVGRVRAHNEDSISAEPQLSLATLADGMGGYNAGEVASGIAVAMVPAEIRKLSARQRLADLADEDVQKMVAAQAVKVNAAIYAAAQKQSHYSGMGTTLVIAYWHRDRLTVGHLGDSRCYQLRGAAIRRLT